MKDFTFNKDQVTRDKLLRIPADAKYGGGIEYFKNLSADTLRTLIEQKFIDPESTQNCSPTVSEFLEFMEARPAFKAHGYAVKLSRDDYRVSIEGLKARGVSQEDMHAFIRTFRDADDLNFEDDGSDCFCWYD